MEVTVFFRTSGKGRNFLAAALALALLGGGGPTAGAGTSMDEMNREKVELKGEVRVYIKNAVGSTRVVGREGTIQMVINAMKKVRAGDRGRAARLMKALRYELRRSDGTISVITRHPRRKGAGGLFSLFSGFREKAQIDYRIEVPAHLAVKVSSASGDVEVAGVEGPVRVLTASGDVSLKSLGGGAMVEVASGDVSGRDIAGEVRIRTSSGSVGLVGLEGSAVVEGASGDVSLNDVSGPIEIDLVSGDLTLTACKGTVEAGTSSGDIRLEGPGSDVELSSSSGDINLVVFPHGDRSYRLSTASGDVAVSLLPGPGYGFELEARTISGSISAELSMEMGRAKITRRLLLGKVGEGRARLKVDTASGDVILRERERR